MQQQNQQYIQATQNWVDKVVIGLNFCPFAKAEVLLNKLRYHVDHSSTVEEQLELLRLALAQMDEQANISTALVLYPDTLASFDDYMDYYELTLALLTSLGYDGIYQLASFHPLYQFADSSPDDPANYTNRSIYPMLHIIRESSILQAVKHYKNLNQVPHNNIALAREKGLDAMQILRASCMGSIG
jgi:hypothetical protein